MSSSTFEAVARTLFPEATLIASVPLTGGVSAAVHRLTVQLPGGARQQLVLREHAAAQAGLPARVEFELLRTLHQVGVPVPEVFRVDDSGTVLPQPYLLMALVEGGTTVVPAQRSNSRVVMCDLLQRIHQTPVAQLPPLPRRLNPLEGVVDWLPPDARWNALRNRLRRESDATYRDSPVLLHGDFWPENLLWRDTELVAVLDWEDAALGDPLSDVAGTGLELRYRDGAAGMEHFLSIYGRSQVLDRRRLALWQVYVAAAAQRFMADWGLPAAQERHMRQQALATLAEAEAVLGRLPSGGASMGV